MCPYIDNHIQRRLKSYVYSGTLQNGKNYAFEGDTAFGSFNSSLVLDARGTQKNQDHLFESAEITFALIESCTLTFHT